MRRREILPLTKVSESRCEGQSWLSSSILLVVEMWLWINPIQCYRSIQSQFPIPIHDNQSSHSHIPARINNPHVRPSWRCPSSDSLNQLSRLGLMTQNYTTHILLPPVIQQHWIMPCYSILAVSPCQKSNAHRTFRTCWYPQYLLRMSARLKTPGIWTKARTLDATVSRAVCA